MLLSLKWLREFVPFEGQAQELGDRLTMLGLELEDILDPYEHISGIVVGHVLTCEKHPESDHLSVCTVDAGQAETLNIVCGAPNVAAGQKVPVALVGTTMPDGTKIKKAKLRGVPSFGMICSERELGLSEDHSGIFVLPESLRPGEGLVDALDLDREVLEIGITPNRADCLSVLGLARETALAFDLPLTIPEIHLHDEGEDFATGWTVSVPEPDFCPFYQLRLVENITVKPSPIWLRYRLRAVGIRPISNIVDVTNLVLMELGQPLHAFDRARLIGNNIEVSPARDGERIVTLDGQERLLVAGDLLIRDAQRPVALAGVMGGINSEINEDSRDVVIESAVFRPASIRKTARRLGLSSEASYRFERGVDQWGSRYAMNRAAALIAELGGGVVRRGACTLESRPWKAPAPHFRVQRAADLLGMSLDPIFCKDTLLKLGCQVDTSRTEEWTVTTPSWRHDLSREVDLIEEVARVQGMDTIPETLPAITRSLPAFGQPESTFAFLAKVKEWGSGLGLNEAENYSFVGHRDLDHLGLPKEGRINILNPLTEEQNVLRTELAAGLLQNVRHNIAHDNSGLRLFEVANIFHADPTSETTAREESRLGIVLCGNLFDTAWPRRECDADYTDLRGIVEHFIRFLLLPAPLFSKMEDAEAVREGHPYLAPCVRVSLPDQKGETTIGFLGQVRPDIADAYHARKPVWLAELNLDILARQHHSTRVSFIPLPVFPAARRDITVMAPASLSVSVLVSHILGLGISILESVELIDLYEPESPASDREAGNTGSPERNLTFRLTFRRRDRTLKDNEVDKEREKIAQTLVKAFGVRI